MNIRFFDFARRASYKSDYRNGKRSTPAIGAVAVYKGSIIGQASNSNKTSPLQAKYNIYRFNRPDLPSKNHAETALLQSIRFKYGNNLDWSRVEIYLYRELKDGTIAMSRPCPSCFHMLRDYGIKKVYYTTDQGFAMEELW